MAAGGNLGVLSLQACRGQGAARPRAGSFGYAVLDVGGYGGTAMYGLGTASRAPALPAVL